MFDGWALPGPHGELKRSPRPLAAIGGLLLSRGGKGEGDGERGQEGRGNGRDLLLREGRKRRGEREGKRSISIVPNLPLHHCYSWGKVPELYRTL